MRAPKRSEYPKVVRIGLAEVPYRVQFVTGKKWLGKCSYKKRTIWLNSNQTNNQLFMTFVHEILHSIEFETGPRIKHKLIYRFEEGLYSVFKNNFKSLTFKR